MKKEVRLYNVMFPIWFFFIWPTPLWLIILPVNFAVDSLVLWFAARKKQIQEKLWKQSILKIWIIGFLSDLLGAGLIFALMMGIEAAGLGWDIFHFPGTTLLSLPGVLLAGLLIYWLNRRFSFRKSNLTTEEIRYLCLALAIFTAPYAMLIPLYG